MRNKKAVQILVWTIVIGMVLSLVAVGLSFFA
jgi:RsiW-degrading membrane proteinase PrsW (M82 family)